MNKTLIRSFLVDRADGQRCYHKLRGAKFARGPRVTFTRADTDKGQPARDVQSVE